MIIRIKFETEEDGWSDNICKYDRKIPAVEFSLKSASLINSRSHVFSCDICSIIQIIIFTEHLRYQLQSAYVKRINIRLIKFSFNFQFYIKEDINEADN